MKMSFCTWCRDWPPIKLTLPVNLERMGGYDVEWIIVDFGSQDGTFEWLLRIADRNPKLKIFSEPPGDTCFSRYYNIAFSKATGEILVCLDADNFIGPNFIEAVHAVIDKDHNTFVHPWSGGNWLDGTAGRMAMHRDSFHKLGGYDESLGPIGFQDLDLRDRARAMGMEIHNIQDPLVVGEAIQTEDKDKMQHLPEVNYSFVNSSAHAISRENISNGKLRANQ